MGGCARQWLADHSRRQGGEIDERAVSRTRNGPRCADNGDAGPVGAQLPALALACRRPGIDLYADASRHLQRTDPDRRDLLLSCGATLHHCTVALAALGWHARVHRFPSPHDPNHLASMELQPQPAGELDVTLAAAARSAGVTTAIT